LSSAPDGITIRAATIEDAAAVHALISELARSTQLEHKFRSSADDYRKYGFGPGALFEALVAEDDGGMVGERLLAELARVAGGQGATHLHLAVDRDNTAAMRFYERCGLRRDESDCIFQIDGGDFDRLGATS
jgi:GNAT superfamily N-acetyltransferase